MAPQDLRKKYSGAVPLAQQEKFAQSMVKLQEDKKQIEEDLTKVCVLFYFSGLRNGSYRNMIILVD